MYIKFGVRLVIVKSSNFQLPDEELDQNSVPFVTISLHQNSLIDANMPRQVQWRLVALKVPEARTQCPTIIVFTTPVGFSERDTHLVL